MEDGGTIGGDAQDFIYQLKELVKTEIESISAFSVEPSP
jgi:hypothetical protein